MGNEASNSLVNMDDIPDSVDREDAADISILAFDNELEDSHERTQDKPQGKKKSTTKSEDEQTNEDVENLHLDIEKIASKLEKLENSQEKQKSRKESNNRTLNRILSDVATNKRDIEKEFLSSVAEFMRDTYVFIMVDPLSLSGLIAWLVFFIQTGCFLLVVSKNLFTNFTFKKLTFPAGVDKRVTAAQFITICMIPVVQEALWQSLYGFAKGFDVAFKEFGLQRKWWFMSLLLRLIEGIIASSVTFWFVLQSEDVLELFKDFTAVAFLSSLDNIVFILAEMEVFGHIIKLSVDECHKYEREITKIRKIRSVQSDNRSFKSKSLDLIRYLALHPLFFASILIILMCVLCFEEVVRPQINGSFLCQKIYVQLDDDANFELSYFSGSYKLLKGNDKRGWYPAYREHNTYEKENEFLEPGMILRFCENVNSWVLTYEREIFDEECHEKYALVRSAEVENQKKFDLFEVSENNWEVKNLNDDNWIPLNHFVTDCEDEGLKYDLNEDKPCTSLVTDERANLFVSARLWSNEFSVMKKDSDYTVIYNHPIYTNGEKYDEQEQELVVFLGKRWAMAAVNDLFDYIEMKKMNEELDLFSYFEKHFHARWSNYKVTFFSEPVTSGTKKDKLSPDGLNWVAASPKISGTSQYAEDTRGLDSVFLCRKCENETNPCFYDGKCLANQTCHCTKGSTGSLCQVLPTGNGYCDEYFNTREFGYDGGDCCENTCMSGVNYKCGMDKSASFYTGYDSCQSDTCRDCWRPSVSSSLSNLILTSISVSSSGRNIALIESIGRSARVYDSDGSTWAMRGSTVMEIDEPSSSSIYIAGCNDCLNYATALPPVTVAIRTKERIHVFDWDMTLWSETDEDVFKIVSTVPKELELRNNGKTMGVVYENFSFRLFERTHFSLPWQDVSSKVNNTNYHKVLSLQMDGNKIILANEDCVELHDLPNQDDKIICDFDNGKIKNIALSPSGHMLAILFFDDYSDQGEVLLFDVESNSFLKSGKSLRGVSTEKAHLEVGNDGDRITTYSAKNNLVQVHQFDGELWKKTFNFESKSLALSSNEQVMAVISKTDSAMISYRNNYCEDGLFKVRLSFITDHSPDELLWELLNITLSDGASVLKNGGPYETAQALILEDICVENSTINAYENSTSCIAVRIIDLGLDGLRDPGKIGISINGEIKWQIHSTDGYDNIYPIFGNSRCMESLKIKTPWPKKYNSPLHMECSATTCDWDYIGGVERQFDIGSSVQFLSISADGSILSVPDRQHNLVQIFKYSNDGVWTQYGSNITGGIESDYFGWSTSLSADGSVVAISAPYANSNGTRSGQIRLYSHDENQEIWYQHGNSINGSRPFELLGLSVSLSADGTIVSMSRQYDISVPCNSYVYKYSKSHNEWIQRVGCFDMSMAVAVRLSSTGSTVMTSSGDFVRVFEYNSFLREWDQKGNDIQGGHNSIAISSDGSVLAVGGYTSGSTKAYKFDKETKLWRQRGTEIAVGSNPGLSLSSDGSVWVITYSNTVLVLTYDNTKNEWKNGLVSFPSTNFTSSYFSVVASSADAITVAVKADYSVDVYQLRENDLNTTFCSENFFNFTIKPDRFSQDVNWFLQNQRGHFLIGGRLPIDEDDNKNTRSITYTTCLPNDNTSFLFNVKDDYGDGICCDWGNGTFTVEWNKEVVMDGSNFQTSKSICLPVNSTAILTVYIGRNVDSNNNYRSLLVSDSRGDILMEKMRGTLMGGNVTLSQCVPIDGCLRFSIFWVDSLFVNFNDKVIHSHVGGNTLEVIDIGDCGEQPQSFCPENYSLFELHIGISNSERYFTWELLTSENTILMEGGDYALSYQQRYYRECVPVSTSECATLLLVENYDPCEHQYIVFWNGNQIANTKLCEYIDRVMLGSCDNSHLCPNDQHHFELHMKTENQPQDLSWDLVYPNNTVLMNEEHFTESYKQYHYQKCVSISDNECVTLQLHNPNRTLFLISWDGNEFAKGTEKSILEKVGIIELNGYCSPVWLVCGRIGACEEGFSRHAELDEKHEVRCCSDIAKSGWMKQPWCEVWGESDLPYCYHANTFEEAQQICHDNNARLCTKEELELGCTGNSGCEHNFDLVWSSTRYNADDDTGSLDPYHTISCGSNYASCSGQSRVAYNTERHEVACCADEAVPGWPKRNNCDVWGQTDIGGTCYLNNTYDEAHLICKAHGGRLCTEDELLAGCTRYSGCGHDSDMIWSSTIASPQHMIACGSSGQACVGQSYAQDNNNKHEVRCCSDNEVSGWVKRPNCDVWGGSVIGGNCYHNNTFDEARSICRLNGGRLCTEEELLADCTKGTGCGHDADMIWSSSWPSQQNQAYTHISVGV